MSFWQHVWNRLKAIPVGVWAALGVGLTLLGLYLRGRRLEAEIARTKLKAEAANAKAQAARSGGRAEVHLDAAAKHRERAIALEHSSKVVRAEGEKEQRRLAALPPDKITEEYLKLAMKKRLEQ